MELKQQIAARERAERALSMRETGLTLREIAKQIGCGPERVRQLILRAERRRDVDPETTSFLSARAQNCLWNAGLGPGPHTKATVLSAIQQLRFGAKNRKGRHHSKIRNFGAKSLREIEEWLGLPAFSSKAQTPPHCPTCRCGTGDRDA